MELVLAHVDVDRCLVGGVKDHGGASAPIDPYGLDPGGLDVEGPDDEDSAYGLRTRIAEELAAGDVQWNYVRLAGKPARALGRLAADRHACVVVVGARERRLGSGWRKFCRDRWLCISATGNCVPWWWFR